MDYLEAAKRFDLDRIIQKVIGLNAAEVVQTLHSEATIAAKINPRPGPQYKRDVESLQGNYVSDLNGLAFIITHQTRPLGVRQETLEKFQPVISALVQKKQLAPNIIALLMKRTEIK
jgi:hypothetical protein